MHITVRHGITIDRPAPEVFAYLSDPTRMPEWQLSNFKVKDQKKTSSKGKLKKGTRVRDQRNVLGKEIDGEWQVVDFVQDERLGLKVTDGPVPWEMTFTLEPHGKKKTFVAVEGGGDLGKLQVSDRAASRACQRMLERDMETLADILETS
jgi:uncharacterized protein YndB with AHSA1/START domain